MDKSSKKSIKECDMSHHKDVCGQKIIYQQTQPSNLHRKKKKTYMFFF